MAISNITNFIIKAVFSLPFIASVLRGKHENISCSNPNKIVKDLLFTQDECFALDMLSKVYYFEVEKPTYELLRVIGTRRVVSVIINDQNPPDLGLASFDSDNVDFYSFDDLSIGHQVISKF